MLVHIYRDVKKPACQCREWIRECCTAAGAAAEIKVFDDCRCFYITVLEEAPDIVVLDICMPGGNGITRARELREAGYGGEIIFYTVDRERWPAAFDLRAFHYLVQPVTKERFQQVFTRAVQLVKKKNQEILSFTYARQTRRVPLWEILYFEVCGRIITVYWGQGETFAFYSTISRLEELLAPRGFLRIHESYLVAKAAVREIVSERPRYYYVLHNGAKLTVGSSYFNRLCQTDPEFKALVNTRKTRKALKQVSSTA